MDIFEKGSNETSKEGDAGAQSECEHIWWPTVSNPTKRFRTREPAFFLIRSQLMLWKGFPKQKKIESNEGGFEEEN